jgi:hypothetical protein
MFSTDPAESAIPSPHWPAPDAPVHHWPAPPPAARCADPDTPTRDAAVPVALVMELDGGTQTVAVCTTLGEAQSLAGQVLELLGAELTFGIHLVPVEPGGAVLGTEPARLHVHAPEGPHSPAHVVGNTAGLVALLVATVAALRERSSVRHPGGGHRVHAGDGAEFAMHVRRDDDQTRWPRRLRPYTDVWARDVRERTVHPAG